MAKIFISYRRDDDPAFAARVRDGLAQRFGNAGLFMDVDNLLAGQRFDEELAKALAACDVLIAIIGERWSDLLKAKAVAGERDYVREEISAALNRNIIVIPVLVGRERKLPQLPLTRDLPEDIRDLVQYQKHDVSHEQFGRDSSALALAIATLRKSSAASTRRPSRVAWIAGLPVLAATGYVAAALSGAPVPWFAFGSQTAAPDQKAATLQASSDREREARTNPEAVAAAKQLAEREARRDPASSLNPGSGQSFRDCSAVCPEMVLLPAGSFTMGLGSTPYDSEKPPHAVTISKPFAVGKFSVTFSEWDACAADGGCIGNKRPDDRGWGRGQHPVINVSWNDAQQYLTWLSRKSGKNYRLLSEAEWEYAARAGSTTRYWWGDDIGKGNAACDGCGSQWDNKQTAPVGSFGANKFGLYDMVGNVWQWVADSYHDSYLNAPTDGSLWQGGDTAYRVGRGGSWNGNPDGLRSAYRGNFTPGLRDNDLGFRVARAL